MSLDERARPDGGDRPGGNPATGKTQPTSAQRLARIARRRRAARELTALIRRLDGGSIQLPAPTGQRCDRPCLAVDRETLHLWFMKYGSCPCEVARRAAS